jgi:hypothetical protein
MVNIQNEIDLLIIQNNIPEAIRRKCNTPFIINKEFDPIIIRPKFLYKYDKQGIECKEKIIHFLKSIKPEDLLLYYFLNINKKLTFKERKEILSLSVELFSNNNKSHSTNLRLTIKLEIDKSIDNNKLNYTIIHKLNKLDNFKYINIIKKTFHFNRVDKRKKELIINLERIKKLHEARSVNFQILENRYPEIKVQINKFIINYIIKYER